MDQLDQLVAQAGVDFAAAADSAALETAKARYLGKGGSLTELLKGLGKLDPEARKTAGAEINKAKSAIEAQLNACRDALQQAALEAQLAAEALDVTLPGRGAGIGGLHRWCVPSSVSNSCFARSASTWPKARRSRPTSTISRH